MIYIYIYIILYIYIYITTIIDAGIDDQHVLEWILGRSSERISKKYKRNN